MVWLLQRGDGDVIRIDAAPARHVLGRADVPSPRVSREHVELYDGGVALLVTCLSKSNCVHILRGESGKWISLASGELSGSNRPSALVQHGDAIGLFTNNGEPIRHFIVVEQAATAQSPRPPAAPPRAPLVAHSVARSPDVELPHSKLPRLSARQRS